MFFLPSGVGCKRGKKYAPAHPPTLHKEWQLGCPQKSFGMKPGRWVMVWGESTRGKKSSGLKGGMADRVSMFTDPVPHIPSKSFKVLHPGAEWKGSRSGWVCWPVHFESLPEAVLQNSPGDTGLLSSLTVCSHLGSPSLWLSVFPFANLQTLGTPVTWLGYEQILLPLLFSCGKALL